MTIGGIVVGVLLAGFVLFSVLGGGEEALPPIGPPITPGTESPSPSPGAGPPIQSFTGRDPFSVPPALSPSPSPTVPGGNGTGTGTPSPSNGGGGTQTPSPTAPGGGSSQNVGGSTVVLLDIFQRDGATHVQVEVDGTVYDVVIGEQFAGGRFELRSVAGNCATFLFGDEQFTLCINAQK
ncbi:MAG TPA: hypothetical protein VNP90_01375 [Actinomycetota bacterium]|nr:hypothetical protein [Actinomycetota bacterium]